MHLLVVALLAQQPTAVPSDFLKRAHTYSIVAYDSATGDLGVAVQSKFPNVGGIVPWARGRGLGTDITRHAQWLAEKAGVEQLVLAVDALNEPALSVYAAAGFRAWESRWVFVRLLNSASQNAAG